MTTVLTPSRHDALVLVLDVEEGATTGVPSAASLLQKVETLVRGARLFGVPVVASHRAGATPLAALAPALGNAPTFPRQGYAALSDAALSRHLAAAGRSGLILAGLGSHAGVQQTALQALATGYRAYVARDAVGSRGTDLADIAADRMARAGVVLDSVESLLLQLCEQAAGDEHASLMELLR